MNQAPISFMGRLLIWASASVLILFIIWAHWAELDQITRANGQIIASSRNQIIQASDGGVIAELPVKEGVRVKKGEILVRFDKTRVEASFKESAAKAAALKATVARLTAEVIDSPLTFSPDLQIYDQLMQTQKVLFEKRKAAIQAELTALESSLKLVNEELALNLPLTKSGDVSRAEILKLQRQSAEIQGQITNRRNKYLQDAQADLAKAQEELEGVQQILAQRKEQLDATVVHAPMDGIVRSVRITTMGGVARPGEEIMQIVPLNDDMIIEAKMKPADIAFVRPGLPVNVKLDAYDYTVYGSLKGTVTYISADTLTEEYRGGENPYYRVQIKTKAKNIINHKNKEIDIQPGMTASVEITTGHTSVWNFLTKPITKTLHESFGER